ncbi:MAG: hypothetical protein AAFX53_15260 [Bacteroidota bacterium]
MTINQACRFLGKQTEHIEKCTQEFEEARKLKPTLTTNDWVWGKLQKVVLDTNGDSNIYWMMARFVARFEGKSGLQYCELAIKKRLQEDFQNRSSQTLIWAVEVMGDSRCGHGKNMQGKQFPIEADYNPANLAGKNCDLKHCTCMYSLVAKRDENGRIILKNR